MRTSRCVRLMFAGLVSTGFLAACSGEYGADGTLSGPAGPVGNPNRENQPRVSVLDSDGLGLENLFGGGDPGNAQPVNKFLWQAALDTLSFMPLSSTDPFTGVIATDWSATPEAPGERFKVTVYLSTPELTAAALKVAVYRQVRDEAGNWLQTSVDPDTPRKLEDAILTRARQIRVAELEAESTG